MTSQIPLSRGLVALVDDEDYVTVTAVGKWYADPSCQTFYARKNYWLDGRCFSIKMHRLITGFDFVDHINGNGLDNRRANLRPAASRTNTWNRARRSDNTTGFKGVGRKRGRWHAYIQKDGQRIALGVFDDPIEAAHAYDTAALELFGAFARPNFPQEESA